MQKLGILFILASSLLLSHQVAVVESQSWCLPILTTYQERADCTDVLAGRFRCNYPGIPGKGDMKYFIEEYEKCMAKTGGSTQYYRVAPTGTRLEQLINVSGIKPMRPTYLPYI
ncbi:hypothetical protein BGZ59_003960 [Podila verticillata]|nr:hypothetical protein BGZ59_003960 [Podila verticillata]